MAYKPMSDGLSDHEELVELRKLLEKILDELEDLNHRE